MRVVTLPVWKALMADHLGNLDRLGDTARGRVAECYTARQWQRTLPRGQESGGKL